MTHVGTSGNWTRSAFSYWAMAAA